MSEASIYRNALPLDKMLLEYRLEAVLGAGGFGMTYLARDTNLEKRVAIKEYLPCDLAVRALDGSIVPVNTNSEYNYKWGLDRFIQEARTLARFGHPNIVRVNRYFEANGTGYMVMDYEAGESLAQYLKRNPMPDEAVLKKIVMPILDGLQAVHQAGFLHRDIKPSNVFIRDNGTSLLLDFGAARLTTTDAEKTMTAVLTPGYAPLEQYTKEGNQGPWSDIYALAGVLYRAVVGQNPPDAVSRMKSDSVSLALAATRHRYSERFLNSVDWGIALEERMRPQSVAVWREMFLGRMLITALSRMTPAAAPRSFPAPPKPLPSLEDVSINKGTPSSKRPSRMRMLALKRRKWIGNGAIVLALVLAGGAFFKQLSLERTVEQRLEDADQDHTGDLDRKEFARMFPQIAGRFDEADRNHDGTVSVRELEALLQRERLAQKAGGTGSKSNPAVLAEDNLKAPAAAPAARP